MVVAVATKFLDLYPDSLQWHAVLQMHRQLVELAAGVELARGHQGKEVQDLLSRQSCAMRLCILGQHACRLQPMHLKG